MLTQNSAKSGPPLAKASLRSNNLVSAYLRRPPSPKTGCSKTSPKLSNSRSTPTTTRSPFIRKSSRLSVPPTLRFHSRTCSPGVRESHSPSPQTSRISGPRSVSKFPLITPPNGTRPRATHTQLEDLSAGVCSTLEEVFSLFRKRRQTNGELFRQGFLRVHARGYSPPLVAWRIVLRC